VGPEKDTPGSCSLDCSKARIGGSEFLIKPFKGLATRDMVCKSLFASNGVTEPLSKPLMFKFTVERPIILTRTGKDGKIIEEEKSTLVGNVSIFPIVEGALDVAATNLENGTISGGKVSPPSVTGIVTPKSEWCSDTCGTVTLEAWPLCVREADNNITVVIQSGSGNSDAATVIITNPKEQ